ncbi:hypothetical protein ACFWNC_16205, partial [Streptomyces sp. NPDC058369]|uniref:hypothetical protein n=1 Tax=Streptomyces sp. NPDC058369 TaxID=3346462 RepID=UPI00366931F9
MRERDAVPAPGPVTAVPPPPGRGGRGGPPAPAGRGPPLARGAGVGGGFSPRGGAARPGRDDGGVREVRVVIGLPW